MSWWNKVRQRAIFTKVWRSLYTDADYLFCYGTNQSYHRNSHVYIIKYCSRNLSHGTSRCYFKWHWLSNNSTAKCPLYFSSGAHTYTHNRMERYDTTFGLFFSTQPWSEIAPGAPLNMTGHATPYPGFWNSVYFCYSKTDPFASLSLFIYIL